MARVGLISALYAQRVYLATPYSDASHETMYRRSRRADSFASALTALVRCSVYSPITHNRILAELGHLPENWPYWMETCLREVERSDTLVVLPDPDDDAAHHESVGVSCEVRAALEQGKEVWEWKWNERHLEFVKEHGQYRGHS